MAGLGMPSAMQRFIETINAKQQEPQEPLETNQLIDNAVLQGSNPQLATPQAMQQVPNPYERRLEEMIVRAKGAYDAAQTDAQRQAAHDQAEFWRNVGNNAGINLNGFGADVSLADARNNLATQEARDVLEAVQGKYARNSDQVYEDEFQNAILNGLSSRRARRLATSRAKEYQANRVAYLNGVINGYGKEVDGSLSPTAYQLIATLANENPAIANMYLQTQPGAKDAYNRQSQQQQLLLADSLDQNRLAQSQAHDLRKMEHQFQYGQRAADAQMNRDLYKYAKEAETNYSYAIKKHSFLAELEKNKPDETQKTFAQFYTVAKMNGYSEEKARTYAAEQTKAAFEGKIAGKGGKGSGEPNMSVKQQEMFNQLSNLYENAKEQPTDENIAALEQWLSGDGMDEKGNGISLPPDVHSEVKYLPNLLRGLQAKLNNDDDAAYSYWKDIPRTILDKHLPNENFDQKFYKK